jgi:TRAP-type C4-dicarboxylate transport system permease small subunit
MTQPTGFETVGTRGPESRERGVLAWTMRVMNFLNEGIVWVATAALLAASLVLTMGVLLRYFLKVPTDWQDETAVFLIVGSVFMCGAYVQSIRRHVGIEVLASVLPYALNRGRRIMVDVWSFAFCTFFSWKSWTLLHEAIHEGQRTSSSFGPPLWIPYGLMALGMTLLSLQILLQISAHILRKEVAK